MGASSAGGPGEHSSGWGLEFEPGDVLVSLGSNQGSWALMKLSCLLVCLCLSLIRACREGSSSNYRHFPQQRRTKCRCLILLSSSEHAARGKRFAVTKGAGEEGCTVTMTHGEAHRDFAQHPAEHWLNIHTCSRGCWDVPSAHFCILTDCCLCLQLCWEQQWSCRSPVLIIPQEGELVKILMVFGSRYQHKKVKHPGNTRSPTRPGELDR